MAENAAVRVGVGRRRTRGERVSKRFIINTRPFDAGEIIIGTRRDNVDGNVLGTQATLSTRTGIDTIFSDISLISQQEYRIELRKSSFFHTTQTAVLSLRVMISNSNHVPLSSSSTYIGFSLV